MKALHLLGISAILLGPLTSHAELVFKNDEVEIRLFDRPCAHTKVIGLLKDEWAPKFKHGYVSYQGKPFEMCWMPTRPGHVVILDEDGDGAEISLDAFKKVNAL